MASEHRIGVPHRSAGKGISIRSRGHLMTVRRATEWGVLYDHAPGFVHPFIDEASARTHSASTGSHVLRRVWLSDDEVHAVEALRASEREELIRELIARANSFGDRHWDQESVTGWLAACIDPAGEGI